MSYGVVRDRGREPKSSLTAGLSGRPGPGERMTQSMLGRTKRWNSSLQGVRGAQMLERGRTPPGVLVRFHHDEFFQHIGVPIGAGEQGDQVVSVCKSKLGATPHGTHMNHSSPARASGAGGEA